LGLSRLPRRFPIFFVVAIAALVLKLWMTSDIRILPLSAPHDDSNFIEHAKTIAAGLWFGPYDVLTLIKGPFFPLFLAAISELGISLPLAHELTYFGACLVACWAIRPLVRDDRALAAAFVFVFFNPLLTDAIAWRANRSHISGSVSLLTAACAAALFVRRKEPVRSLIGWAAGLGCAFGAFWLTREEGIWLVPFVLIAFVPFAYRALRFGREPLALRAVVVALPAAIWLGGLAAIAIVNGHTYGWATIVEVQSPEFVSAYGSLERIAHAPSDRRVPVPEEALRQAFRISPAAAELRPMLEGTRGNDWRGYSCAQFATCDGGIAGGWFMWAFREAVAAAGHYKSGAEARAFFIRLAAEIDAACDAGRVTCNGKPSSLAPPLGIGDVPLLAQRFAAGAGMFAGLAGFNLMPAEAPAPPAPLRADYNEIAGSLGSPPDRRLVSGWIVDPDEIDVKAMNDGAPDSSATLTFIPTPDFYKLFDTPFARFSLSTSCTVACTLHVVDTGGATVDIPVEPRDFRRGRLTFHIDSITPLGGSGRMTPAKFSTLGEIARFYGALGPWLAVLCVLLIAYRIASAAARRETPDDAAALSAGAAVSVAALLAILTVVDTFSFSAFNSEYFSAGYSVFLFGIAIVCVVEVPAFFATLARRSIWPAERPAT
jgi:hypothetical protein